MNIFLINAISEYYAKQQTTAGALEGGATTRYRRFIRWYDPIPYVFDNICGIIVYNSPNICPKQRSKKTIVTICNYSAHY